MIGIYDSGLGGLTVLAALRAGGVSQDAVYFADQAHVPYGDRTDAQIQGYHRENFATLAGLGVELLVMGCNSSCAVGQRLGWPKTSFPILDLIESAGRSFAGTGFRRVAVIATPTTVRSGAYGRAIRAAVPGAEVVEVAAPLLVPLVERGAAESDEAGEAVHEIVAQLPAGLDAVVYGCTHYPLLDRWFAYALDERVVRLDPAEAQAAAARQWIDAARISAGGGRTLYFTTGDAAAFERGVCRWTREDEVRVTALRPGSSSAA